MEKAVKDCGINGYFCRTGEEKTGTCAAIVLDGERSLCANLGAALKLEHDHLNEHLYALK